MNDKIINVAFPKCGSCRYAGPFKQDMADCFGMPPSVHIVGADRDALNRPVLQIETFVPRVRNDRPSCSLYKVKEDFATVGRS
jgi:hypothetical protein